MKNASEASQKLLTQLKTMDKDGVKDLVNNPKQPYKKKVLNIQAREKLRQQMREKLKRLGNEGDALDYQLEPDECIDYEKIPETLIAQIGKTMDLSIESDEMDLSESINECNVEDRDIEVVTKNLGSDFLMGSEMLLMNGFSLLAETENDTEVDVPPLPSETQIKPPSPPPEPSHLKSPVYCSLEQPWSKLLVNARPSLNKRLVDEKWDIESAKNPDPPSETLQKEDEQLKSAPQPVPPPTEVHVKEEIEVIVKEGEPPSNDVVNKKTPVQEVKATPAPEDDELDNGSTSKPANDQTTDTTAESQEASGKRANETYGEYRRRLAIEQHEKVEENADNSNSSRPQSQTSFNQNQRNANNWRDNEKGGRGGANGANGRRDNWMSNNRQNNRNDPNHQNRKSRYETDRGRDRNNFQQRNLSRDTNNSHDSGRQDKAFDDVKDVHNYRFQSERNSQEPPIERLNTLLNPKPLQFNKSFNKRSNNSNHFNRSRSRDQTPANNSIERDFDESLLPPLNDVRPCLKTLKKVMEIDAEMNRVHEKIHGIDKVIANLQSERITHQKTFSRLQHNRKVLFDNLMKRATSNIDSDKTETTLRPSEQNSVPEATPSTSQKSIVEKKLQNIVDQKKRKHEEQSEEPMRKKQAVEEETTTSAAAKAAQLQRQREEEERQKRILEKKRLRKLRKQREQVEKERVERIRKEASVTTTIKTESRDKATEKVKDNKHQHHQQAKSQKPDKPKEPKKIIFKQSEMLTSENVKISDCRVKLRKLPLSDNLKEQFKSFGCLPISHEDWEKWIKSVNDKSEVVTDKKIEVKPPVEVKNPEITEDPLAILESNIDPLALDELLDNPPTPGSNITPEDDSILVEIPTEQDYSEWSGEFTCHDRPIVHLQNINGKFVVCATENGKVYKYHLNNGKIAGVFSKHTQICNSFLYDGQGSIYTVSSDGFVHKIKFKVSKILHISSSGVYDYHKIFTDLPTRCI